MDSGERMVGLIRRLSPLRMAPNSAETDLCAGYLGEELPFQVHEFAGGAECNGWIVPMKWEVEEAKIYDEDGTLVYDGMHHPMAVIGYSRSFSGMVETEELRKHLFFSEVFDDALIYHCDLFYKPFREEWGFSVPKLLLAEVTGARYRVDLRTRFEEGTMKVLEYTLPGDTPDVVVLNAHNCHAFQCNDDLSGVAIGIEAMRSLAERPRRRFTYKLIVAPEHYGSIFYLDRLGDAEVGRLRWGVFLESLGTTGPLVLQRSFLGNTLIDRAFLNVLEHAGTAWETKPFRKVVGNDETCWEAVGYDVPFPSLSRMPYPEYHTSHDSPDLMDPDRLEEALHVVLRAFEVLERDAVARPRFRGLVALSHPRYDLYKPFLDPSEPGRRTIDEQAMRWNYLMDCLPRYFDGETRTIEIAERHQIPFAAVAQYLEDFEEKALVTLSPAPATNPPVRVLPPM